MPWFVHPIKIPKPIRNLKVIKKSCSQTVLNNFEDWEGEINFKVGE
jgi:hypothetical protein